MKLINAFLYRGFFVSTALICAIWSFCPSAASQESYPSQLSRLSVTKLALIQAINPQSPREKTPLSPPDWEKISSRLLQKDQKTSGDYCLIDFYLVSSQENLVQTLCTPQSTIPGLLEETKASPLEQNLSNPSESAWGMVSSKAFVNLGIGSDIAVEFYLAESNSPTVIHEDITEQLAFLDDIKSRIMGEVTDMAPFGLMKSKSSDAEQRSSSFSTRTRSFPISPFFKWNAAGLALKWKW